MKQNMLFTIEGFIAENPSENQVFVNGIQLNPAMSDFAWGYNGTGAYQLAMAILDKFIPRIDRDGYTDIARKFTDTFVNGWGYGDFLVQINMFHWLRFHAHYKGEITFSHPIAKEDEEWDARK